MTNISEIHCICKLSYSDFLRYLSRGSCSLFPQTEASLDFIHFVSLNDYPLLDLIILQARRGHRWNHGAKSFVEQLEGISSSVLLDRVGQAKKHCGESTQCMLK